jgi:hypothetical protein
MVKWENLLFLFLSSYEPAAKLPVHERETLKGPASGISDITRI